MVSLVISAHHGLVRCLVLLLYMSALLGTRCSSRASARLPGFSIDERAPYRPEPPALAATAPGGSASSVTSSLKMLFLPPWPPSHPALPFPHELAANHAPLARRSDSTGVTRIFTLLALAPLLALFPHAASAAPTPAAAPGQPLCNGLSHYCDLPYPNLTQIGAHDAAFVGPLPTQNQHLAVADQLGRGVRLLQAQVHDNGGGTLEMCHTSCLEEDAGSLQAFFATVRTFLDAHPTELVTLLLVNGDRSPAASFAAARAAADLKKYAFVPPGDSGAVLALGAWPTVGAMLGAGARCVVFLDAGADTTHYPALLDEFSYFFETPYGLTSADDFGKCGIDRPPGAAPDERMYLVNHFLDVQLPFGGIRIPNVVEAGETNSPGSIQGQAGVCEGLYGRGPKVVLLDYVDLGDGLAWERQANGVS